MSHATGHRETPTCPGTSKQTFYHLFNLSNIRDMRQEGVATAAKTGRGQSEGVGLGDCHTLKASGKHQCLATLKQTYYRSCNPSNIRAMAGVGVAIAATSGRGHSEGVGSPCDCHTLQALSLIHI